jgi:hypothetical protein
MFNQAAIGTDQNIGNWDVGKVTNPSSMFSQASAFNQGQFHWDVSR